MLRIDVKLCFVDMMSIVYNLKVRKDVIRVWGEEIICFFLKVVKN